jgi:hypothetical protein
MPGVRRKSPNRESRIRMVQVDPSYVRRRHRAVKAAIREGFRGATFNFENYSPDDIVHGYLKRRIDRTGKAPLLALDEKDHIVGACFDVSVKKPNDSFESGDYGWFFASPSLGLEKQVDVANRLIERAHDAMRSAGFKRVIVGMGTREGERFLRKRHGYRLWRDDDNAAERLYIKHLQ